MQNHEQLSERAACATRADATLSRITAVARWTLIFTEKGYSMRYFLDADQPGRVAIADNSGMTPSTTDDGVIYVDTSRPMQLELGKGLAEDGFRICLPLVEPDGEERHTWIQLDGADYLLSLPILVAAGLRMECDPLFKQLVGKCVPSTKGAK